MTRPGVIKQFMGLADLFCRNDFMGKLISYNVEKVDQNSSNAIFTSLQLYTWFQLISLSCVLKRLQFNSLNSLHLWHCQ
jgi:hypothetical protein